MSRYEAIPVISVSLLLALYSVLVLTGSGGKVIRVIFLLSPLFIGWMVVSVLRNGTYKGRELQDDEEWGYSDRQDFS